MPRSTLQDVADRVGVSTATASLVLRDRPGPSDETRSRVRAAAEELGYRADRTASLLASRRSNLVGVVLDITSAYHGELIVHLDEAAAQQGLELVLVTITQQRSEEEALRTIRDSRCEAVVLLGSTLSSSRLAEEDQGCPVVVLGRDASASGMLVDSVLVDDAAMAELAVAHLADAGHRRIAHIDGGADHIAEARRAGYDVAVRRRGLEPQVLAGGDTEQHGMASGKQLLALSQQERPTAVLAFNDRCALGAREVVVRGGWSIPEDLAIVGIDDSPLARLATVGLTSIGQDPAGQARAALAAVRRRWTGEQPKGATYLAPHLKIRRTG